MSGVDDELAVDFASEDSAIGTEPDSPVAADFKSKQPFATNKARDAGPAKSEIDARLAGEEGSRLKVEGRPFQLDALDVAGVGLSQNEFAGTGCRELVDEKRLAAKELAGNGTEKAAVRWSSSCSPWRRIRR